MRTGAKGQNLIRKWEAFRAFAYPDIMSKLYKAYPKMRWGFMPAGDIMAQLPESAAKLSGAPWTVGFGETEGVDMFSTRTQSNALEHLLGKLRPYEDSLTRMLAGAPTTQGQFDAMMALLWNIGEPNFKTSTVLKAHKRGDYDSAARAFRLFNKARNRTTGQLEEVQGLTNRRAEESSMYALASPKPAVKHAGAADVEAVTPDVPTPLPSSMEVEPESRPMESPINRSAVIGGGSAAVATVAETMRSVSDIKDNAIGLSDLLVPGLLIIVVVLFGYIAYQRYKQRKEGWA